MASAGALALFPHQAVEAQRKGQRISDSELTYSHSGQQQLLSPVSARGHQLDGNGGSRHSGHRMFNTALCQHGAWHFVSY